MGRDRTLTDTYLTNNKHWNVELPSNMQHEN